VSANEGGALPLEGITVVSLEQAVAAPFATRTLADLGARVIKVERTAGGDFARGYDSAVRGMASHFVWLNRSKESIALDAKLKEGRAILSELVAHADVLIQNLAPGSASRLGLAAAHLRSSRPELIVVDLSGYGSSGPYRNRKAYDMLVQAEAGLVSVTGTEGHPAKTGIPTADIAAGLHASHAILAALLRRANTGEGASIEVSMLDSLVEWMGHPMYTAMYSGRAVGRHGLAHPAIAPYDAFPTADGQVLIGVQNDRQWVALAQALERPRLGTEPGFATNIDRVTHRDRLDADIAAATRGYTTTDLLDRLAAAGVPAAQVTDVRDLAAHPQLQGRNRWTPVLTETGMIEATRPPAVFQDFDARMDPVPALGQHTDRILAELGRDEDQIAQLRGTGVVA
jgi:itaconate CoA-transferase